MGFILRPAARLLFGGYQEAIIDAHVAMEVPDLPCASVEHVDTCPIAFHFNCLAVLHFAGDHKASSSNGSIGSDLRGLVEFDLDVPVDVMIDGEVLTLHCESLEVLPGALDVIA